MVQLLPGADEETISYLEKRVGGGFPEVTFLLQEGMNPEKILDMFLGDEKICFLQGAPVSYQCNCSRERMERNLLAIGKKDLTELSLDPKGIDLECHFCDQRYHFSQEDVKALISEDAEES